MDSQSLWQHLQALCKHKPDKIQAQKHGGDQEIQPPAEELMASDNTWERESKYYLIVWHC